MRSHEGWRTPVSNYSILYSTVFDNLHDYKGLQVQMVQQENQVPKHINPGISLSLGQTSSTSGSSCTARSVFPISISRLPVKPGGYFGTQQQYSDPLALKNSNEPSPLGKVFNN